METFQKNKFYSIYKKRHEIFVEKKLINQGMNTILKLKFYYYV